MKITIIGGGGRVGSCAAFALQCAGLVAEGYAGEGEGLKTPKDPMTKYPSKSRAPNSKGRPATWHFEVGYLGVWS